MAERLCVRAPAKLNLALAVGPPAAAQGLHPICSWMVTVDLFDELTLTRLAPGTPGRLSRYAILWHEEAKRRSDINWSVTKDLAVRAHLALQDHVDRELPVQLKLEKRIPVGGGLGGGSSDAAAMLRGLNALFDLGLTIDELASIGAQLGSDVAFLVHGGSAIVEGFGERIEPQLHMPELDAVIAFPEVSCPTAGVYRLFDELAPPDHQMRADAVRALARARVDGDEAMTRAGDEVSRSSSHESVLSAVSERMLNDLTAATLHSAPTLAEAMARLSKLAERPAHMAGSGSGLFVLCEDAMHAEHLAEAAESQLRLPAVAVRTVGAHALME